MGTICAKAYDNQSTPEEIDALRERVYWLRPGVLMYREVPVPSPFQIEVFGERLEELTRNATEYSMVMDLSESAPPSRASRRAMREVFGELRQLKTVAVFTGRNFLITAVAKLILRSSGVTSLVTCKREDQALEALARAANKHVQPRPRAR